MPFTLEIDFTACVEPPQAAIAAAITAINSPSSCLAAAGAGAAALGAGVAALGAASGFFPALQERCPLHILFPSIQLIQRKL